ncbi:N-6 DNA methylase [Thalassospira sp. 11-3]|nr:N-6 DNA methylase [Thalassospira sp. 11-3]PXX31836.1 N-6 DNA methylase [Thalassospira sp. 11-3]
MGNHQGFAQQYKEVVHEDTLKIGGKSKAPDYSFRIGGVRKFFLEAKKPWVNIKDDLDPAYQLRRYAWSAKLSLSILTDFEEFSVYDTRIKPKKTDKAGVGRILYMRYDEYEDRWGEIASVFSKDAIFKGGFDKWADDLSKKKGTLEVDEAFLAEIEGWRATLAKNIYLRNNHLSQPELNEAVQKTIDRIIFLRICEDRGIEPYQKLGKIGSQKEVYKKLCDAFKDADDRYNSGLFHFKKGDGSPETLDTFTLGLKIDDKPLKEILGRLYFPDSPYEFSVLSPDILGQVYERFLGKVIQTKAKRATIEEKPEVRKAGGVYYTPVYIVERIVKTILDPLLKGKSPNVIAGGGKAPALRILDPACGSGSFLISAYQYLIDWHTA